MKNYMNRMVFILFIWFLGCASLDPKNSVECKAFETQIAKMKCTLSDSVPGISCADTSVGFYLSQAKELGFVQYYNVEEPKEIGQNEIQILSNYRRSSNVCGGYTPDSDTNLRAKKIIDSRLKRLALEKSLEKDFNEYSSGDLEIRFDSVYRRTILLEYPRTAGMLVGDAQKLRKQTLGKWIEREIYRISLLPIAEPFISQYSEKYIFEPWDENTNDQINTRIKSWKDTYGIDFYQYHRTLIKNPKINIYTGHYNELSVRSIEQSYGYTDMPVMARDRASIIERLVKDGKMLWSQYTLLFLGYTNVDVKREDKDHIRINVEINMPEILKKHKLLKISDFIEK